MSGIILSKYQGLGNDYLILDAKKNHMQLIGKKFDEKTILNLAYKYEQAENKFIETKWGVKL